jgi:hypothetical protein
MDIGLMDRALLLDIFGHLFQHANKMFFIFLFFTLVFQFPHEFICLLCLIPMDRSVFIFYGRSFLQHCFFFMVSSYIGLSLDYLANDFCSTGFTQ